MVMSETQQNWFVKHLFWDFTIHDKWKLGYIKVMLLRPNGRHPQHLYHWTQLNEQCWTSPFKISSAHFYPNIAGRCQFDLTHPNILIKPKHNQTSIGHTLSKQAIIFDKVNEFSTTGTKFNGHVTRSSGVSILYMLWVSPPPIWAQQHNYNVTVN
jgi:hypothetical protein